ncbi:hypothetical protein M3O96_07180 [Aquiflexum sp. TKW24L]|uniref:hypothetical protein n=1 Tax=Aquiflexum sp. TKW24L TaxID=2942212 RepID=UPI0020BF8192|nr:hypothetical protein [Aquiflexum sp. TKW24L]MCL6258861.1 hypothetical protein [Aquiflexum sp. TKW24L]
MDLGNIVYIIAIIAYFIYTATRKKRNPEEMDQPDLPEGQEERRKPASFEDLLKEIRQGQGQREKDLVDSGQGKSTEQFPGRNETRTFEQKKPRPVTQVRTFEQPQQRNLQEVKKVKRYENFEGVIEDKRIPERVKLADQERIHGHYEGIKSSIAVESLDGIDEENKYKTLLRNPESVKDAIILSEILNRKYF